MRKEKSLICKEEGVVVFIDDYKDTILDTAKHGIKSFLMDEPWNQGELPLAVQRVKNWEEIVENLI